jgi:hypothetical protein
VGQQEKRLVGGVFFRYKEALSRMSTGIITDVHVRHKKGIKPLPAQVEKVARAFISKYYKSCEYPHSRIRRGKDLE